MRISFDLDETLVCSAAPSDSRRPPWFLRRRYPEALRQGTCRLMGELHERGCEIWIYTTSFRSPRYVRGWFRALGIPLDGVINQDRHLQIVGAAGPSKCPRSFGIDIHVDDSEGVRLEGRRHGFHVVVAAPDDPDWWKRILDEVDSLLRPDAPTPSLSAPRALPDA